MCHSVRSTRQVKSNPSICLFFYDLLNVFFLFDDLLNVLDLMCVCVCVCVCVCACVFSDPFKTLFLHLFGYYILKNQTKRQH